MKKVYVIRYSYRIDGEECCGNFEFCYTDEKAAEKAMLQDIEDAKKRWSGFGEKIGEKVDVKCEMEHGDNGLVDYCSIWIEKPGVNCDYWDRHYWWIDMIGIAED